MSIFEDTNPRALKDLLSEVNNRTMVLPDFQRDFVWEPGATQELIVSIANNYPAGRLIQEQGIDDHHIFPDDFLLKVKGVKPSRARDCVLNRTLIDRTTNQMISNRAPSDYLKEIRNTTDFPFEAVLRSHSLPTEPDSPLLRDDYEEFLTWRQARLWQEIQRVTGATVAADLEAESQDSE